MMVIIRNKAEVEHLKIWLEADWDDVKIPEDKKCLKATVIELEVLKEKIDQPIHEHISSIANQKLRSKTMQKLQGELFK